MHKYTKSVSAISLDKGIKKLEGKVYSNFIEAIPDGDINKLIILLSRSCTDNERVRFVDEGIDTFNKESRKMIDGLVNMYNRSKSCHISRSNSGISNDVVYLTLKDELEIVNLYKGKLMIESIAEQFNVSTRSIYRILRNHGLTPNRRKAESD